MALVAKGYGLIKVSVDHILIGAKSKIAVLVACKIGVSGICCLLGTSKIISCKMLIVGLVLYLVITKLGLNTIAEGSFLYGNGLLLYKMIQISIIQLAR